MPYLSEIRIFSFNFPPRGWALCNGQTLPISGNQELFALLGTSYGGDGVNNFGLPNLLGRVPMHVGNGIVATQQGGEAEHTLIVPEIPSHTHDVSASGSSPNTITPSGANWASNTGFSPYGAPGTQLMAKTAIAPAGRDLPHQNMSPFLVLNFCISLTGVIPVRDFKKSLS